MKIGIVVLLFLNTVFAFKITTGAQYTGWPQNDSTLNVVIHIEADTSELTPRDPIQVIYLIDISEKCAGNVRQGLIDGGKALMSKLRNGDSFGIVLYSEYNRTLMPLRILDDDVRKGAAALLDQISTEKGRNLSDALTRVNEEFKLRPSIKSAGKYLVVTSLGKITDGEKGDYLFNDLVAGSKQDSTGYCLFTLGYGEEFNEDLMIQSAVSGGGQPFYVAEDYPDSIPNVMYDMGNIISNPTMKDIEIYLDFPDSNPEPYYLGTNIKVENPIKIRQLARGQKYNIPITLTKRYNTVIGIDAEIDYYSLNVNSRVSQTAGTRVSPITDYFWNDVFSPPIIAYSIFTNLSENIGIFRRVYKEMTPQDANKFRKEYAYKFQQQVVDRVETIRNTINNGEIIFVYKLVEKIYEDIRDGVKDNEYIIRKAKYHRQGIIYGRY